jgi:hypothetical protein
MAKKPVQRRTYSYIQFSCAEKEKGDSLRRQAKLRDQVLKSHPEWFLDESLMEDFVHHLGHGFLGHYHCHTAILCLANHRDVAFRLQQGSQTLANHGVIIHQLSLAPYP